MNIVNEKKMCLIISNHMQLKMYIWKCNIFEAAPCTFVPLKLIVNRIFCAILNWSKQRIHLLIHFILVIF